MRNMQIEYENLYRSTPKVTPIDQIPLTSKSGSFSNTGLILFLGGIILAAGLFYMIYQYDTHRRENE